MIFDKTGKGNERRSENETEWETGRLDEKPGDCDR